MPAVVCYCTCPDAGVAERVADALVSARLAACVNILPGVRSVYRWQGAVERADELLLLIKTTRDQVEPLAALVASLHPYELPEVLAVEVVGGSSGYLDWVIGNSSGSTPPRGD